MQKTKIRLILAWALVMLSACNDANNGSSGDTGSSDASATYKSLMQNLLINADYWDEEPKILAAGLGFTNINGVPGINEPPPLGEEAVREAGGTWNTLDCGDQIPSAGDYTSAATPAQVALGFGVPTLYSDGLPIEMSWPVLAGTLDIDDIQVTLSDGSVVKPEVVSIFPNFEYNERSTIVIFGQFGNRYDPTTHPDEAIYPVFFEIVDDDTPLLLAGPHGQIRSAVGLTYGQPGDQLTAYKTGHGPTLVAAKLSVMSTLGENGPAAFQGNLPNDGVSLYMDRAQYRLRILTTGGFSPDGVLGVRPTEFARYFRLRAETGNGEEVLIEGSGVHTIDGYSVEVVGLADLGLPAGDGIQYNDCYDEDHDNQIDIVLAGDEGAMRRITHVEIRATVDYDPLYNPGGPGNAPTPGVAYSMPSPRILQEVTIAIDDPMTVSYGELQ